MKDNIPPVITDVTSSDVTTITKVGLEDNFDFEEIKYDNNSNNNNSNNDNTSESYFDRGTQREHLAKKEYSKVLVPFGNGISLNDNSDDTCARTRGFNPHNPNEYV